MVLSLASFSGGAKELRLERDGEGEEDFLMEESIGTRNVDLRGPFGATTFFVGAIIEENRWTSTEGVVTKGGSCETPQNIHFMCPTLMQACRVRGNACHSIAKNTNTYLPLNYSLPYLSPLAGGCVAVVPVLMYIATVPSELGRNDMTQNHAHTETCAYQGSNATQRMIHAHKGVVSKDAIIRSNTGILAT